MEITLYILVITFINVNTLTVNIITLIPNLVTGLDVDFNFLRVVESISTYPMKLI